MIRIVSIALFLCYFSHQAFSETISSITFEGLTKTKKEYLERIIRCKVGEEFDPAILREDEKTIRSLNLFFNVESSYAKNESEDAWDILFELEEAKYLYPILSISGFKGQFKLQAGFNQINFRGHAESIGFLYQYYDRHSFSAFYNALRHKNGLTGHDIAASKYSTVEPLYFEDTTAAFNFDNYNFSLGGHFWIKPKLRVGLGGMYMYEKYKQLDSTVFDLGKTEFFFHKYQIRSFFEYANLDVNYERVFGFKNYTYLETIQTIDFPGISFIKFTNDIYWYKEIGNRGNFAIHNRFGISTNNMSPFSPFVLDGFLNVRGIGNRVSRGTAELINNIEYRHTIWKHKWFYLQVAGLIDFGTLRQPGDDLASMFTYNEMQLFTGGGLRLHSRKIYNVVFRVDYSVNPMRPDQHGLTFGVGQFF
ncbi:MAG: POTRA domain-containing protein [Crocinitomicaceae bacterium]